MIASTHRDRCIGTEKYVNKRTLNPLKASIPFECIMRISLTEAKGTLVSRVRTKLESP